MQINLPVSQREYEFPASELLVSTTDTRGVITHCNEAFVRTSGFTHEELIGQPHHLIRHPDMPEAAFRDLWRTIGRGQPWSGLVKNRRKDGDHYWVLANVTPILHGGKPAGYLSVRTQPVREDVAAAEELYRRMREERGAARPELKLEAGVLVRTGASGWMARLRKLPLGKRLGLAAAAVLALSLVPEAMDWQGTTASVGRTALLGVGLAALLSWLHRRISSPAAEATRFAGDLAGCNLAGARGRELPEPLGALARRLQQIQVNLRAVVGDVRAEMGGFSSSAAAIAQVSADLSARTEAQAASLERAAASMEQLAGTVRQTADAASHMAERSEESVAVARRGEQAVREAGGAMEAIQQSTRQIGEISDLIESIAFQTNILALNAAVEAARAGEQGRGFAVVASEVRSLAQRSAAAAKQIRQLSGDTARHTASGGERIRGAGSTLQEVMASVSEVGTMVRRIADATHEQSQGIAEVNAAVLQLDAATQQNAALAEQCSASAAALHDGAGALERSIAVFRLPAAEPVSTSFEDRHEPSLPPSRLLQLQSA